MVNTKPVRVLIIAEAGVNHDGDIEKAIRLVDAAADAGADVVKFQTFSAERLVASAAPKAEYQKRGTSAAETQYEMLKRLELSPEDHRKIRTHALRRDVEFMSTPFDEACADFLLELGVHRFKVSSGDLTNIPFLRHLAATGLPVILSTGMATMGEVERAVDAFTGAQGGPLSILHCTSNYPTRPEDVNLRAMQTIAAAFGLPVGYSDNTLGIEVSVAAVALGARIIEKHFTLDTSAPGPDHAASLTPGEFKAMVHGIRTIELALGDGIKRPGRAEREVAAVARKSIFADVAIPAGTRIARSHLTMRRPGTGLGAELLDLVVGRLASRDIGAGEMLGLQHLGSSDRDA
jgi:N-acetylneuraminate synthase